MSYLGEGFLGAMFSLCGFALCLGLAALKLETDKSTSYRRIETAKKVFIWARRAMLIAAGLCVVVLLLLTVAFLTDDFSIAVVGQYSSKALPFFYKLSAVWAGSAGSLLLWSVGVFVLFGLWLIISETNELNFSSAALSVGSGVCLGFSALLVFVEKPFASSLVTVDDGVGLNPLLQNFWMITHPPLLFVGYSAFLVPFVIVCASVFSGRAIDSYVYRQLRRWMLFGICFLSLGVATGARWSYIELGWGGYWAWDPVENASLLPWLLAVAALHSYQLPITGYQLWAVVLTPVPFIMCLVATFITRSGILQSVHSFDRNVMFSALLTFIACCFLLWLICIIQAARSVSTGPPRIRPSGLNKREILFWTNVVLIFTAVVIGTATFWPIVSPVFTSSHSGLTLTRLFYDRMISVVGILLAFMVGLGALADLQKRSGFILKLLSCCAAGLFCFGVVFGLSGMTPLISLTCGICAASGAAVLIRLWLNLKVNGRIGGNVAHLGILVLVVAAGLSSNEQVVQTQLTKGGKISLGEYTIVYDSFEHKLFDGVIKVGPEVVVRRKGLQKRLWPHNNLYPGGQSTSEVAVHTGLLEDVYISFDGVGQDGRVVVTAKVKPLMFWLWSAALLIVAGSVLAMLEGGRGVKPKAENAEVRMTYKNAKIE